MKIKTKLSDVIVILTPIVFLLLALVLDRLETVIKRYFGRLFLINTELWLLSLGRIVFVIIIFGGVVYFIQKKDKTVFQKLLWLGLGVFAIFASTPWGLNLLSFTHSAFFLPFPHHLFFLAGAFLLVTGSYGLLKSSS